ncbi:unnamed protein product [Peronospora belbahrii]|uniref:Uncharacterized protein n=1 Tax=Peronospora belbahrii TaxID=622444 RepID=A0AAU9KX49_9STRA|nr:unnamed protein product [Peronospora belbahrii]
MFKTVEFPTGITNLDPTLTKMNRKDFTHCLTDFISSYSMFMEMEITDSGLAWSTGSSRCIDDDVLSLTTFKTLP